MVTQLAREARAYVVGAGRADDCRTALDFGAKEFVDLDSDSLEASTVSTWCSMSSSETSGSGLRA